MIKFLLKGIIRDRSRSFFPILIVALSVSMIIFFQGFMTGIMNGFFKGTSVVSTGHVKIMTSAYHEESQLLPNDLALIDINSMLQTLDKEYPDFFWTPRINFAGLLDVPDESGETLEQSPFFGIGIDMFSKKSRQIEIWELERKLIEGVLPKNSNEVLLSTKLLKRLKLKIGDYLTFIGSTMHGAFTTYNFKVVGTFALNMGQVDKEMMLLDISGARVALDMDDAASEILGYSHSLYFEDEYTVNIRNSYNLLHKNKDDIFSPIMLALRDSHQMGTMVDMNNAIMFIILSVFMIIVMIVLWNMGLMSGLRRYGEIGMRLAIGESKGQVYRAMILESIIIGFIGTTFGTMIGLSLTYYLQEVGIDYSKALESISSTNMILPNVFYAQVTPDLFYIGFIPGVLATVLGTMLAGRAIYKREMAQLFKELEA